MGLGSLARVGDQLPAARHNFHSIPRIRSESPAFDLHHPEIAAMELAENDAERQGRAADAPDVEGREEMLQGHVDEARRRNDEKDTDR